MSPDEPEVVRLAGREHLAYLAGHARGRADALAHVAATCRSLAASWRVSAAEWAAAALGRSRALEEACRRDAAIAATFERLAAQLEAGARAALAEYAADLARAIATEKGAAGVVDTGASLR